MAGLVPAIHGVIHAERFSDILIDILIIPKLYLIPATLELPNRVDGRGKPGHDAVPAEVQSYKGQILAPKRLKRLSRGQNCTHLPPHAAQENCSMRHAAAGRRQTGLQVIEKLNRRRQTGRRYALLFQRFAR